eukprot:1159806-Pelagomonas_calceolata.AAC.8
MHHITHKLGDGSDASQCRTGGEGAASNYKAGTEQDGTPRRGAGWQDGRIEVDGDEEDGTEQRMAVLRRKAGWQD